MKNNQLIKVVLAGQPNVGKTMLINSISNSKLKIGNFTGVTVEKKEIFFKYKNYQIKIVDLPGSYSLDSYTVEEKVTKNFLDNETYDIILNVIDSTNLERNLYLTSELLALNKKMIIALNMNDEAKKENIIINEKHLSEILGKPCIKTSASTKQGIDELLEKIVEKYENKENATKLIFSDVIEKEIKNLVDILKINNYYNTKLSHRQLAIKLLKEDKQIYKLLYDQPIWIKLQPVLNKAFKEITKRYDTNNINSIFNEEKIIFAKDTTTKTLTNKKIKKKTLTDKLDKILIHKFFGLPIFLFLMWGLFQVTFIFGNIPMDIIDAFFTNLANSTKDFLGNNEISSIISDGAITGVGAVMLFVPNIIILFLGITLLETTGYMSRVAFLLDGFLHKFGLHGKSFIPLITGFGCSLPAYYAARTLKNEKDRLVTLYIIGFMSCGARLPIYVLFTGAFFSEKNAGNMLFLIYIIGAFIGLIAAKSLKSVIFKSENEPFVMEMPKYRLPSVKLVYTTVLNKALMYLKKAGTFILAVSLLIWFGSNYPKHLDIEKNYNKKIDLSISPEQKEILSDQLASYRLENSYLGYLGKFTQPFFAPLGFDWKMAVALETGLAAKEVVISTLGILYGLGSGSDENSKGLVKQIKTNFPFSVAVAFIVFIMIYLPCLAASMVFRQEAGGWKHLFYLFVFTQPLAHGYYHF